MTHPVRNPLAILAAATLLAACSSGGSGMMGAFRKDAPPPQPAVTQPWDDPAQAGATMRQPVPAAPYILTAEARGNCIEFAIRNTTTADIPIQPSHFAVIPRGSRQVVPYEPTSATIDAPRTVRPGETARGRAMFRGFDNPEGSRLVFKPDARGTFAVIATPTMRAAR